MGLGVPRTRVCKVLGRGQWTVVSGPALGHLLWWDDGDLLPSRSWVQAHLYLAHVKDGV